MMDLGLLSKPFPPEMIKKTKGRGRMLDYIHHKEIGIRLDKAVGPLGWKFEILRDEKLDKEIIVWGKLSIKSEEGEWIEREGVGGSEISLYKSGEVMSIVDDTKKAVTDCFKRCAARFGVGRDLYGTMDDYTDPEEVYDATMASVQKGEDGIAPFLKQEGKTNVAGYRKEHLGHDELTKADLETLEAYYKRLREDYGRLRDAQRDTKNGTEQPPNESTGNKSPAVTGDVLQLRKDCAGAQQMAQAKGAKRSDVVKLMTEIFGTNSYSEQTDTGKLAEFMERVKKLGEDAK
jgi:hypothetical protein